MVVGVSGKIASGKNLVSEVFKENSWKIIDLDKIGHEVLEEKKAEVIEVFTIQILDDSGNINRKELSRLVFKDKNAFSKLEAIVHPVMIHKVEEILSSKKENYIINAAILFKLGLHKYCDLVLWIKAPVFKRLRWLKNRNRLIILQIIRILLKQKKLSPKPWQKDVDIHYIDNKSSPEDLKKEIAGLISKLAN